MIDEKARKTLIAIAKALRESSNYSEFKENLEEEFLRLMLEAENNEKNQT